LQRLGTNHSDLYQIHLFDYETSIDETLNALNDVVRSGEVRYLSASNLDAWQLMKAIGLQSEKCKATFVPIQNCLFNREE
jgi:aryl-alcohol dehydrogenase-like predicted oxidoreductase